MTGKEEGYYNVAKLKIMRTSKSVGVPIKVY